jgi:hypothetical protein
MKTCTLFDKYRDGELSRVEEEKFRSHLAECAECKVKTSLLDNLALILKKDPAFMQADLSVKIAKKAFQENRTWDAIVLDWIRPGPAFAALSLICIIFSALWIIPNYEPTSASSEFEKLLDTASAVNVDTGISQIQINTEMAVWLQEEVRSQ